MIIALWVAVAVLFLSLAYGIYAMRKGQKNQKKPDADQLEMTIAQYGVKCCAIGGTPIIYGNTLDKFNAYQTEIRQKGGK